MIGHLSEIRRFDQGGQQDLKYGIVRQGKVIKTELIQRQLCYIKNNRRFDFQKI